MKEIKFQKNEICTQIARRTLLSIFDSFDHKYIINMSNRRDRRDRIIRNLAIIGLSMERAGIRWFDAMAFDDAAGFPGVGVRGCFNSHQELMRRCGQFGQPMLVMEDDVDFDIRALAASENVAERLHEQVWDIVYLGYIEPAEPSYEPNLGIYPGLTIGGHFYGVQSEFAAGIADWMAAAATRQPGDPQGGPMYRDAAFNMFRSLGRADSKSREWTTRIATPCLARQYSSRSDLRLKHPFYDEVPSLRAVVNIGRSLKSKMRARSTWNTK